MQTSYHQIKDYSAELDRKYGAVGTKEREQFDEAAWNFYTGQLLLEARKESKVTQEEVDRFPFFLRKRWSKTSTILPKAEYLYRC